MRKKSTKILLTILVLVIVVIAAISYLFVADSVNHINSVKVLSAAPSYYDQLVTGLIAYDIPDSMAISKNYKATVSITKALNDSILFSGLSSGSFKKEKISISSRVKVRLIDPTENKNFEIYSLDTEEQLVDDSTNTTWNWNVRPIRSGENSLVLIATVKILDELGENYKDIPVFEKSIEVKASFYVTAKQFVAEYWQWLTTVIIIPLLVAGYKKITSLIKRRNMPVG